jgi:hypothetical protein
LSGSTTHLIEKLTPTSAAYSFQPNLVSSVESRENIIPECFVLSQNYPNPFNPTTVIQYRLPGNGIVTLEVYNHIGQHIKTLVNQLQTAGIQQHVVTNLLSDVIGLTYVKTIVILLKITNPGT